MAKSRVSFMSILSLPRKRGRPRLPSWDDILPWSKIMHPEDLARSEAEMWLYRLQTRNKGGRPPQRDYDKFLLEIADHADRQGIPRRTFVREVLRAANPSEDVSEDLVLVLVRRIRRERAKARANIKK